MNKYFIARNGQKLGPYSVDELRQQNLTANDMVWAKGMSDWTQARHVPELTGLFPAQASTPPPHQAPPQNGPQYSSPAPKGPKLVGLLVMSIMGIIGSLFQIGFGIAYLSSDGRSYWSYENDCWYQESQLDTAYQVGGTVALIFGIFLLVMSIMGIVAFSKRARMAR